MVGVGDATALSMPKFVHIASAKATSPRRRAGINHRESQRPSYRPEGFCIMNRGGAGATLILSNTLFGGARDITRSARGPSGQVELRCLGLSHLRPLPGENAGRTGEYSRWLESGFALECGPSQGGGYVPASTIGRPLPPECRQAPAVCCFGPMDSRRPATLPDLLTQAAARGLGGWHFHSGREVDVLSVKELHSRARQLSTELERAGIGRGIRVGIVGPNCVEWAVWAWATWISGAALLPLPAPLLVSDSFAPQVSALVDAAGCSVVVGDREYLDLLGKEPYDLWDWGASVPQGQFRARARETALSPLDLAVVLCTSGSTAAPKAVRMSHARAVEWATHNALLSGDGAVPSKVTWFPFYHIAGLGTLFEVVTPVNEHLVSMKRFLADPVSWLRLVSETRAAYAVSPSSVWSRVLDGLARDPDGIDLSHLERLVFNAEMTEPDVLARLGEVCRPLGLRPGVIAVHYASSDAGMISKTPLDEDPRVETLDLAELVSSGRAIPAVKGAPCKAVVSCGRPYPGAEICVGHPHSPLPERLEGDVWVRGPGVTDGYLNTDSKGRLIDGWLRLGDLGYIADGELWVTGRADEVVVLHGEKYHPEDIEWAVSRDTGLGSGRCAAFARRDGEPGGFIVVLEREGAPGDLADRASAAIVNAIGIAPVAAIVVTPGTIPTTPNGKVQRAKLRELWADGTLTERVVGSGTAR